MSSVAELHQRGLDALNAKNFALAVDLFNQAIARDPNVARNFVNRGQAFRGLGQVDRAIDDLRHAIKLQPNNAIAHFNLGVALRSLGQTDLGMASYRAAIRIKPDYAKAHYNLANALRNAGKLEAAETEYRAAIAADPGYVEAWNNLGELLEERRRIDESLQAFERAIALRPQHAGAHFNRGFLQLLRGDYETGWTEYEWRFAALSSPPFSNTIPSWTGEDLHGKSILLVGEQGAGDTMQFARFARLLGLRGAKVIVRTHAALTKLMRTVPGVAGAIGEDDAIPPVDFYIPILSIPWILGTTLATIPRDTPYVAPDPADVQRWRERIAPQKRKWNIGLCWAGSPVQKNDRNRSAPLSALRPLAGLADAAIFSLQKGEATAQIADSGVDLIDLSDEIHDFSDTAALIANLDIVVSVCTSVAHVAGAMGKRTLVMLCFNADWRWLLDRDDSPWYPTMKLFRQKSPGDWADVARRVAEEIQSQSSQR